MNSSFQNLSSQFNSLLSQYRETYKKFINVLNSNNDTLINIPNTSFQGNSNINIINNSDLNSCKSSCLANSSCSGSTFNNVLKTCTLTNGLSGTIISTTGSTSIVSKSLYYSFKLQEINNQLININKQMLQFSNNHLNEYNQYKQLNYKHEQILMNNYQTLEEERIQIDNMINQFTTLNSAYEDGSLILNSNYYFYIILLFFVIFLVYFLIRYSILNIDDRNSDFNMLPIIIGVLICIILIYYIYKK
jgi:hypothetical protein